MAPKKKKAIKKKIANPVRNINFSKGGNKISNGAKDKPKRKLIASTVGKLSSVSKVMAQSSINMPSVSKAMPEAASVIPSVSRESPSVSKPVPLVSAVPNTTIPKYWGIMPSKKWGASKIPTSRKRKVKKPKDIGLFNFVGKVITAPMQPIEMIKGLTSAVHSQAQEERDLKTALEQELLELKMRREMDEISKQDYEIKKVKIKRRIKNIEEKEEEAEEKPKKRKRKR